MAQSFAPSASSPDIMTLPDHFDSAAAFDLQHDARTFIQNGVRDLVLDFHKVTFMTAQSMHVLLQIAKTVHAVQGHLKVRDMMGQPKVLFESCLFDTIISHDTHANPTAMESVAKMAA